MRLESWVYSLLCGPHTILELQKFTFCHFPTKFLPIFSSHSLLCTGLVQVQVQGMALCLCTENYHLRSIPKSYPHTYIHHHVMRHTHTVYRYVSCGNHQMGEHKRSVVMLYMWQVNNNRTGVLQSSQKLEKT